MVVFMINLEQATEKVKNYLAKMKGYDLVIQDRLVIDFLDFEVYNVNQTQESFLLFISMLDGLLSGKRVKFQVKLLKENGEITDVKRIQGN